MKTGNHVAKQGDADIRLDILQRYIEDGISYAVIQEAEDVWHEDDERVIRAFTFNKGTREQVVVIGPDGYIYYNGVLSQRPVSVRLIEDLIPILVNFKSDTAGINDEYN